MARAKTVTPTHDAAEFLIRDGVYRFPFVALDPTPGGRSLGRIEWIIEPLPLKSRGKDAGRIGTILVWARQTRDARYAGKVFAIPTNTDGLTFPRHDPGRVSFMDGAWWHSICREHRSALTASYPPNHATALVVETRSSLSGDVYYEIG